MRSQNDMIYVMDSSVRGDYCQANVRISFSRNKY